MADFMRGFVQTTREHQRERDHRLTTLELWVGDDTPISEASKISGLVALIATRLKTLGGEGNRYPVVYNSLYQRYGIAKYRNLVQWDFKAARTWLRAWLTELETGNTSM